MANRHLLMIRSTDGEMGYWHMLDKKEPLKVGMSVQIDGDEWLLVYPYSIEQEYWNQLSFSFDKVN